MFFISSVKISFVSEHKLHPLAFRQVVLMQNAPHGDRPGPIASGSVRSRAHGKFLDWGHLKFTDGGFVQPDLPGCVGAGVAAIVATAVIP